MVASPSPTCLIRCGEEVSSFLLTLLEEVVVLGPPSCCSSVAGILASGGGLPARWSGARDPNLALRTSHRPILISFWWRWE